MREPFATKEELVKDLESDGLTVEGDLVYEHTIYGTAIDRIVETKSGYELENVYYPIPNYDDDLDCEEAG